MHRALTYSVIVLQEINRKEAPKSNAGLRDHIAIAR